MADDSSTDAVQSKHVSLKRQIGAFYGGATIITSVVGTGIFVSPVSVLRLSGSVGLSLIVWVIGGLIELIDGLINLELGTSLGMEGGAYMYVYEAFGQFVAFCYLWLSYVFTGGLPIAMFAQIAASYIEAPIFTICGPPTAVITTMSFFIVVSVGIANCLYIRYVARLNSILMFVKLAPLVVIIGSGIVFMARGHTSAFENAFEGTSNNAMNIAFAILSANVAYNGGYILVSVAEEVKNPKRTLPISMLWSFPVIMIIYLLANMAYLTILSKAEIMSSSAVAVNYAMKGLGMVFTVLMPVFIGVSAIGTLTTYVLGMSRYGFAGSRTENFPKFMSMLNIHYSSPVMSIVILCILATPWLLLREEATILMGYLGFIRSFYSILTTGAYFYFRVKRPDMERPFPVPLCIGVLNIMLRLALVTLVFIGRPVNSAIGVGLACTAVPVYFVVVYWQNKPRWFQAGLDKFTTVVQCFFKIAVEGKQE